MKPHDFLDEDLKTEATLYVLDALADEDARKFRLHITRCGTCRAEVESLSQCARELALLAPSVSPPTDLWRRVIERVRAGEPPTPKPSRSSSEAAEATQIWKQWGSDSTGATPDFTFLAADESGYERTAVPGIEARRLFVDRERGRVTMLVRMRAGTAYPAHVHADVEECFVLSGDLTVGDTEHLRAGDYQRAETGSTHAVQSTNGGCVLLLVSSLHDELV